MAPERGFEVFGVDIHASRGNDDFFLSALEIEIAGGVEFPYVAGAVPALCVAFWVQCVVIPVASGDSAAAHQDFTVFGELDFASIQHLADGSLSQPERVIDADDRSGLGQAIALDTA